MNLTAGLEIFCVGANRLFGADRTSVWIHDRRGRQLVLQGSSDPGHVVRDVTRERAGRARTGGGGAAARARGSHLAGRRTDVARSPCRCAAAGAPSARSCSTAFASTAGGELDLLDRADELGRQLSSAIETMQLLDEVMRSRRELENTFDSIWHLVVVSDRHGRIVQVNEAFANRVGKSRAVLLEQP